jgi:hypothetical protein
MSGYVWFWICFTWFGSAVAAGIIGHARQAVVPGAILGLFLGPIGLVAAFALDGRSSCPHCAGKLDGRGQICQHCNRPIRWHDSPSESSVLSLNWLRGGHGALECPYCATRLQAEVARCPQCSGAITWAKGVPLKVSRHDAPEPPDPQPTGKPWSQFRRLR